MNSKRILCTWLPNWPVQRLVVTQPELKDAPILLHYRDARRGLRIAACSSTARRLGVRQDMPIAEAVSLVERGRGDELKPLLEQPHQPDSDLEALADLAIWCQQFSPLVGWQTVASKTLDSKTRHAATAPAASVDYLLLDIAGLGSLFGSEADFARRVAAAFRRRGYYPSVAIASTIGAAWALARFGTYHRPALPRCQAWFAADETEQLGRLPIAALRAPTDAIQTLQRLGVSRIGQLEELPRRSLRSRFGPELLLRLEQLRGEAPETLSPFQPPDEFTAVWDCDPPTSRRDNIEEAIRRLIVHVASLLRRADRGAVRIQCVIQRQQNTPLEMQAELFQPTCNSDHLFELMRMQLEQIQMRGSAVKIKLSAAIAAPLEIRQEELFQDGSRRRTRQFSMFLNRVTVRLGGERVLRPRKTADPQPERSCLLEAAYGGAHGRATRAPRKKKTPSRQTSAQTPNGVAGKPRIGATHRPLKLYEPPRRIETTAVVPDGPPVRFEDERRMHSVSRHWGPERIETGWWRGPSVRRDYYRVETEEGRRYWLFRELAEDRWFLHGVFN